MKKSKKSWSIFAFVFLGLLLFLYLGLSLYYQNRFLFGSTINGIDYAGKTVEQVMQDIDDEISTYTLSLHGRNNISAVLSAQDIGYHYVKDNQISQLQEQQNPFLWPMALFGSDELTMEATTAYDEALLEAAIESLPFFDADVNIPPENAEIVYTEGEGYVIEPEKENSLIQKDILTSLIQDSLEQGITSLQLADYGCYEEPVYRSSSSPVQEALEKARTYTELTVTYDFGSRSEVLDRSILHEWIIIDDHFNVSISEDKINDYVSYLNYHYTTFGISRQFTKQNGKAITIKGGDYGWWINRSAEARELLSVIEAGKDVTRQPVYFQTAASREPDDIGNSYIEVNLNKQKLWVFLEGEAVLQSDIVTGNLSRNYGTPAGIYSITYKERNATLVGEDYSSPVSYWMPFNGNIGFHDASWRNEFGKDIYKTRGSHGCVNMPPKKAEKMYGLITKGMPVIVY